MTKSAITAVILAAGKGMRMKSRLPKGMHAIAGRPMIGHVLATVAELDAADAVLVVGPDMDIVSDYARSVTPDAAIAIQHERLGTGDAVRAAESAVREDCDVVLVIFGDTPLVQSRTLKAMAAACLGEHHVAVLGFEAADPAKYGRLVLDDKEALQAIVEFKDATPEQVAITLCNGGAMAVRRADLFRLLGKLTNKNAAEEYYLTDIVGLARAEGLSCTVITADEADVQGVNSRADLAVVEAEMQKRLRLKAMEGGATLSDPETVHFCADTQLGQDVTIGQHVVFGPDVQVADNVTIKPFCHIEGTRIEEGAQVGPYARLRPGSVIGRDAHIGNFVETKKAAIEQGAKVNHLTYIGDARVGAGSNIGAGTITCNYDGFNKYFTDIGKGAFVGSNSSLVAPVKIGDGAYIGSGSVVTKDVAGDALAVTRPQQTEKAGWAARFRAAQEARKKSGSGK
ncbi:MAG: bifunctional UDP-N-acetylglucosamine diphosphorylase/glucosamine-1-phosphate N-acetyltransferase GlmU [Rhizobiales bacterium]|nr:bifunctional UDP-N-acetylglucosamine diphosphorylase/glucosamine-1-phosphate N-acetyltransferase GlmU [Hyphomicrobiales bacterium]